ncbi:T9SS type A sorting domain-containing protein [bacterium]|nr:T9SS type A sorting domain-containing protein [bacterium]
MKKVMWAVVSLLLLSVPCLFAQQVWDFETDLENWISTGSAGGAAGSAAIEVSADQALSGVQSAKLTGSDADNQINFRNDTFEDLQEGDTLIFNVWISAADLALVNGAQIFWQDAGWAWHNSDWIGAGAFTADTWTTFKQVIPALTLPLETFGFQLLEGDAASMTVIYFDAVTVARPAPPVEARPVVRAAHPPAIDGVLDGIWKTVPWNKDFVNPAGYAQVPAPFRDAALSWRAMWDDDYLYLFISANDDTFEATDQVGWKDDGFELWLDGDNSKGTAYDGVNDLGYGIVYTNDPDNPLIFNPVSEWHMGTTGHLYGAAYSPLGVDFEIAIPMANLGTVPAAGHLMGLDVDYNDDDNGDLQDTKTKWFDITDNSWQNPSLMGTIELVDRTVGDVAEVWYTDTPPVMDGVVDALWDDVEPLPMNNIISGGEKMDGWDDVSMDVKVRWDLDNLYVLFEGMDDTVRAQTAVPTVLHHNDWHSDCIEIWLDGDNSKAPGYDYADDRGFEIAYHNEVANFDTIYQTNGYRTATATLPAFPALTCEGFQQGSVLTDDGFIVEVSIPLDSVGILPLNHYKFGVDFDYDDDDSGDRDTKVKWWGHVDAAWNQPVLWGTAELLGGPVEEAPAAVVPAPVDKFASKVVPVIDGIREDVWNNVRNWKIMNSVADVAPEDWWDCFGNARVAWDAKNFYLFVEVHDDTIVTSNTEGTHLNDNIEIYFDGNNSKNPVSPNPWAWPPEAYDADDEQIRFVYGKAPGAQMGNIDVTTIEYAWLETDSGYNLEALIPWKDNPASLKAAAGKVSGFEIKIGDNDDVTRESILSWWAAINDEAWHDPSAFGTIVYTNREVGPVLDIHYTAYPIKIDAEEDYGWMDAPPIFQNLRMGTPVYEMLDAWDDLEVTWKALWDYNNLYFLINVIDDTLVQDGNYNWTDDNIAFWIDGDASQKTTYDGINDWGFSTGYDPVEILKPIWNEKGGLDSATVAEIAQAKKLTDNGLVLEVAFPLAVLDIEPGAGTQIGLEVDYDDDDDGGTRDIKGKTYDATDMTWQNPSLFGLAKFVGSVIKSDVEEAPVVMASSFGLSQNYPNPFNPVTTIEYSVPAASQVRLTVYNMVGQRVATLVDGRVDAGSHTVQFDASNLTSGIYIYRLQTADKTMTRKLTFIK